mmetsp:Transcript_145389/g.465834  ORF Transcript_145389/g.465834 Transcript_145389/m.465834 type:complete len:89 (-) Transcript_145389:102-368(-)
MGCSLGKKTSAQVQEPQQQEQTANPNLLQAAVQEQKEQSQEQSAEKSIEQPQGEQAQEQKEGEEVAQEVVLETEEGAVHSVVCCGYFS